MEMTRKRNGNGGHFELPIYAGTFTLRAGFLCFFIKHSQKPLQAQFRGFFPDVHTYLLHCNTNTVFKNYFRTQIGKGGWGSLDHNLGNKEHFYRAETSIFGFLRFSSFIWYVGKFATKGVQRTQTFDPSPYGLYTRFHGRRTF